FLRLRRCSALHGAPRNSVTNFATGAGSWIFRIPPASRCAGATAWDGQSARLENIEAAEEHRISGVSGLDSSGSDIVRDSPTCDRLSPSSAGVYPMQATFLGN